MRAATVIFVLLGSFAAAPATLAQTADPPEPGEICTGGYPWEASPAETSEIENVPVPPSYRQRFESEAPCVRWSLGKTDLINWHLNFGSLRSITAALKYLERDYTRDVPAPERYADKVRRAYETAVPDIQTVAELEQTQSYRFEESSATIGKLECLVDHFENYYFLAEQYLRAAEEYGDAGLLGKAETYLDPVAAVTDFLEPLENAPPADGVLSFNLNSVRVDDLRMRLAVLKAEFSPSRSNIAQAQRLLDRFEPPAYTRALAVAYSGGEDFCDIAVGYSRTEEVEAACDECDSYALKVLFYGASAAQLSLLGDDAPGSLRPLNRVAELIDRSRDRYWGTHEAVDDMLRLYRAKAAYHSRRFRALGDRGLQDWYQASEALRGTEALVPPYEAPARFERIARQWLALWQDYARQFPPEDGRGGISDLPEMMRYASYLRQTLANIDAIASGSIR